MADFTEIAERVWVARYPWLDLNVTAIGGRAGLLVVDTHGSAEAAREVIADVRRLGAGDVIGVINTHEHFDHTFGNAEFAATWPQARFHAHEWAAEHTIASGEAAKAEYAAGADPHREEVLRCPIRPAEQTFSSARVIELGDRMVELIHLGRGHTAGDLVVRVPACDVLVAGDLIEESAAPSYGPDSFPLEWADTLALMSGLLTGASVVVPGHGACVDRDFVADQQLAIGTVAQTLRDLVAAGVPEGAALGSAQWPFPTAGLGAAVARGYAELPRPRPGLPLV